MDLLRKEIGAACHALIWSLEIPFSVYPKPSYTQNDIDLMSQAHYEFFLLLDTLPVDHPNPISLEPVFNEAKLRIIYVALCAFIAEIGYDDSECMTITNITIVQYISLIQKMRAAVLSSM